MAILRHTTGPWKAGMRFIFAPDPTGKHPYIYVAEIADDDDEGRIASPEQQVYNGFLIAEAPMLLRALEDLVSFVDDQGEWSEFPQFIAARAAIARATGDSL